MEAPLTSDFVKEELEKLTAEMNRLAIAIQNGTPAEQGDITYLHEKREQLLWCIAVLR